MTSYHKNTTTERNHNKRLNAYMANFPNNATSWSQATDEMRDLCRTIRMEYNEMVLDLCEGDPGTIEGINYREIKTPAAWNQESKKMIRKLWKHLPESSQNHILAMIGA